MELILYINHSEQNRLNKTLSNGYSLTGTLREETSITNPVILIEIVNPTQYNYVYIPDFNRYYYISDMTSVRKNLWRLTLKVDVLTTYKNSILNINAILSHSENIGGDNYLSDRVWRTKVKTKTDIITFPSGLSDDGHFILITAGG